MSKNNLRSRSDYLILGLGLFVWLMLYIKFAHRPDWQVVMTGLMGAGYVVWGYWHHARAKSLYSGVMWEYTTFGILAVALVIGVLQYF